MKARLFILTVLLILGCATKSNAQYLYPPTDSYVTFSNDGTFYKCITIEGKYSAPWYIFELTIPNNMNLAASVYGMLNRATIPEIQKIEGNSLISIPNTQSNKMNFGMTLSAGRYRLIVSGLGGEVCHVNMTIR